MKKQILFLAVFTLALVFAGMNSYGQAGASKPYQTVPSALPSCVPPTALSNCTASALTPVQGTVYNYSVTTANATDDVRWFVINTRDFAATDSIISALNGVLPSTYANIDPSNGTGDYIYGDGTTPIPGYNVNPVNNDATGTSKSIDIAWKYFDGKLPNQVLLVAYVEDNAGCTNNLAVFRIIPQPAFTIDIVSVLEDGSNPLGPGATINSECVSPIESANYVAGNDNTPGGTLTVNYGENWVFFVVNGANYIDSWMPEFQLTYTGGTAPVAEASWAYLNDATVATATNWKTLTGSAALSNTATTWTNTAAPVIAGASAASPGTVGAGAVPNAAGECIVVRVRLDWGTTIEHDQAAGVLTFAANGIAYDGVGTATADFYDNRAAFEDLHHADCLVDGFTNDKVNYEITPRPQVEPGVPAQETKTGQGIN